MDWLRSHVERCLQDVWDVCRVVADGDGQYPFRFGTAGGFVAVEAGDPPVVRVWAEAVTGTRRTARLLIEINEVNARSRTAHAFFDHGSVVVEQALHADGVNRDTLAQAFASVGTVADDIGAMIAAVYGGRTPFPVGDEPADEQAR